MSRNTNFDLKEYIISAKQKGIKQVYKSDFFDNPAEALDWFEMVVIYELVNPNLQHGMYVDEENLDNIRKFHLKDFQRAFNREHRISSIMKNRRPKKIKLTPHSIINYQGPGAYQISLDRIERATPPYIVPFYLEGDKRMMVVFESDAGVETTYALELAGGQDLKKEIENN